MDQWWPSYKRSSWFLPVLTHEQAGFSQRDLNGREVQFYLCNQLNYQLDFIAAAQETSQFGVGFSYIGRGEPLVQGPIHPDVGSEESRVWRCFPLNPPTLEAPYIGHLLFPACFQRGGEWEWGITSLINKVWGKGHSDFF